MSACRAAQREKTALLGIAGLAILSLGVIALVALGKGDKVSSESSTLVGVIAAGLAAFAKDAVQTIRAFWQDDRIGKMTDQIAASIPPADVLGSKPTGTIDDPVAVTDVAVPKEEPKP